MTTPSHQVPVALEIGKTRVFASALDWPGWTRIGRDEAAALEALLAYGPRYQRALRSAQLSFNASTNPDAFGIAERLPGGSATDFGAPNVVPAADAAAVDTMELERLQCILRACWQAFAETVGLAADRPLRKGPRGGGRTTLQIADHVIESHYSYLRRIYWHEPHEKTTDMPAMIVAVDRVDEQALAFATSDEMPTAGPRGGALWTPRYFVRRAAWHILDHTWEIEDKLEP